MIEQMKKELPQWEKLYLGMVNDLTDREKKLLNGDPIRSHEGMMYGRMYSDWKRMRGYN